MKSGADFLLAELRAARTARGMSQEDFGKLINYSGTHVGNVESGTRPLKADYVAAVDQALNTNGLYSRLLERLGAPIWLREWIDEEQRATALRWYEPAWMPGLLQTPEYARATLADELLSADVADRLVTARLARQALLRRDPPPLVTVVLDGTVIRRVGDGQESMIAAQLAYLAECAELPHVQVHIVPESVGIYTGLTGPFVLASQPGGGWVACADGQLTAQITDRPEDIATLERRWDRICGVALPRRDSLELIRKAAGSWT
ncbi:helix-turn-helix domain-containing protein [Micromonospora aurantiaca (nom. illeg.)]|uniref:helix-turn-helix domain-containing protein n=1 Tax=Micromonospora aurantiaca (nom. illeg.) TaxID=47850 RepID=UPI0002FDE255|nr:helix-turn-helix transcriptional regulator [Micromonospora aurantiaca]